LPLLLRSSALRLSESAEPDDLALSESLLLAPGLRVAQTVTVFAGKRDFVEEEEEDSLVKEGAFDDVVRVFDTFKGVRCGLSASRSVADGLDADAGFEVSLLDAEKLVFDPELELEDVLIADVLVSSGRTCSGTLLKPSSSSLDRGCV
jgi:hypothetical protein